MSTVDEVSRGYRLLTLEPIGHGRHRLYGAAPARMRNGYWQPQEKPDRWDTLEPSALEHPSGEVEEFGTGFKFDCRRDFLQARGAVRTVSPSG